MRLGLALPPLSCARQPSSVVVVVVVVVVGDVQSRVADEQFAVTIWLVRVTS